MEKRKPMALVHDSASYLSTFMPLTQIRDEECPDDLREIFHERDVIEWHRIQANTTRARSSRFAPEAPSNFVLCHPFYCDRRTSSW